MTWHSFWILIHVLLLTYWLGADLGVFYTARFVVDRSQTPSARAMAGRILFALDMGPRICLVLMLPVGLLLARNMGLVPISGVVLAAIWLASLAWLGLVVWLHSHHDAIASAVDLGIRIALAIGLVGLGLVSLASDGPLATTWLPAKVLAYAFTVACGLGIRLQLRSFGTPFASVVAGTATPEDETLLNRTVKSTYPLVFAIWIALVVAAGLGIAKPSG